MSEGQFLFLYSSKNAHWRRANRRMRSKGVNVVMGATKI